MPNQGTAPFYSELMDAIKEANSRLRPDQTPISFRSAVIHGLVDSDGNALQDSFTTKIKAGLYKPTFDRLVNLGKFLGLHPSRFKLYRERYAQKLVTEDPDMIELMDILCKQNPEVSSWLMKGAVKRVREILTQATSPRGAAA